jgi:hypothetical protein
MNTVAAFHGTATRIIVFFTVAMIYLACFATAVAPFVLVYLFFHSLHVEVAL